MEKSDYGEVSERLFGRNGVNSEVSEQRLVRGLIVHLQYLFRWHYLVSCACKNTFHTMKSWRRWCDVGTHVL